MDHERQLEDKQLGALVRDDRRPAVGLGTGGGGMVGGMGSMMGGGLFGMLFALLFWVLVSLHRCPGSLDL